MIIACSVTKTEHVPNAEKETFVSDCQTNCYRSFGFRFSEYLQILLFEGFFRIKGEIMFDNTLTIVISHYCIFTEALLRLIPRGFRLLSSLPRLQFSSHRGEFAAITFGKDEVLPRANGPIVSSGTVLNIFVVVVFFKKMNQINYISGTARTSLSNKILSCQFGH